MSVVSANDNVTNIEVNNELVVSDVDSCSFNDDSADVSNSANTISLIVDEDVNDIDSASLNFDSQTQPSKVMSTTENVVKPIVSTFSNIATSVNANMNVHKSTNNINNMIDDILNPLHNKNNHNQVASEPAKKTQDKKTTTEPVEKQEQPETENLPETGIPILPLILVLFIAFGLYKKD